MTFDDDPFADLIPSRQDDDPFADLIPQAGLTNPQGVSAGDYGRAVMAGGGQLFSGAGWLASKVPGLEGAGQGMQRLGQQASDFWVKGDPNAPLLGEGMSPAARAEQGKDFIKKTDDGSGFFGYEWGDASPHTAGLSAAQSLLGTAAGMGVGGVMTKGLQAAGVGARTAGVIGYGAGEAGVASGSAGRETYRSIMEMPVEKLEIHPEFQELMEQQPGADRDSVKEQIANLAANQAAATTAGTTFALSTPMGALIGKIMAGVPFAATKPRAIGTAAAGEAGQEFLQSGAEQMAQNQAVQDYADQSRGIGEGVLNAAVGGAAAGGIMGGGLGFSAVTEVQGERDAIAGIKGIAENFAFDQISNEQLDNAIQAGHELHQKYKDAELKSALDALAAEKILRAADGIVPPGQQAPQQGSQAAPAEQIIGAEPEDDVAADPNALPQEPPGFFGPTAGLTMPGMQPPVQTIPPPEATGYEFTGQAPESFDPFADLVPQQERLAAAKQELGTKPAAPQPIDPAILRQQKAKANYQKSAKIDEKEDNLGRIVAKLGGIRTDAAELDGFDKHDMRGYGWGIIRAFNKGSKADTLDGMRERLNDYGFDFPDTNSLIEALREDMAGRKIYNAIGNEAQAERMAIQAEQDRQEQDAEQEDPQLGPYGQYDPPIDEYTGDMYEPADANTGDPEYNPNWSEEAREIYELLEEASAIDKQAAMDIWESGRDERDVAVALYDFIRDNESGAQGDRGEGEAQQGTGAQAEAPGTAETTATEGVTPNDDQQAVAGLSRPPAETVTREPVPQGAGLADTAVRKDQVQADVPAVNADLLGDDTRTAQSVADAKIQKDKKPAEEPALVQHGDELFANNGKLEPDLFDAAAHEAATSPKNDTPQPTEAQIEAGNYRKGHVSIYGLDVSIENPIGSTRSGTSRSGKKWSSKMKHHYGYIKGTVGRDKDHVDVFIGDGAEKAQLIYVVDQIDPETGKFDEHKVVMTDGGIEAAKQIYLDNYQSDWKGMGSITAMPIDEFKAWVKDQERTKKPVAPAEPAQSRLQELWSIPYPDRTEAQNKEFNELLVTERAEARKILEDGGNFEAAGLTFGRAGKKPTGEPRLREIIRNGVGIGYFQGLQGRKGVIKALTETKPAKPIQDEKAGIENPEIVDTTPQKELKQQESKKEPQPEAGARSDSADKATSQAFTPTHELPDGTQVVATDEPGVWVDEEGSEIEDDNATPIEKKPAKLKVEAKNEPEELDQPSKKPLAGVPAGAVSQPEKISDPGKDAEAGSRTDSPRNEPAGEQRDDDSGGVGDDQGEVPVSAGGKRSGGSGSKSGGQSVSGVDSGAKPASAGPGAVTPAKDRAQDFSISPEDQIGSGGAKTKFKNNVAAIELLKALQRDNRQATRAEQSVLAKYVGWGGIPQAFYGDDGETTAGWEKEAQALSDLLTEQEYDAARRSTQDAHYTSTAIVSAIWGAAHRFGFRGGKVLEPSVGVGNFFGLMPKDIRAKSGLTGVELDHITGGIAKQLYPGAHILDATGFQEFTAADNTYDLAIGNPPFGSQKLYDGKRKAISNFSIHNYFFAKSVDLLKPNGMLAMVVSNSMLDAGSSKAREYISARTEFIGAIRLPNNAFKANAGTEVTTDIVFLRKLRDGEQPHGETWNDITEIPDPLGGEPIPINEYFARHPENMLGRMERSGSMYRADQSALVANEGQDTAALINEAVSRMPRDFMDEPGRAPVTETIDIALDVKNVRVGSMFKKDGEVYVRKEDEENVPKAEKVEFTRKYKGELIPDKKAEERAIGMIIVRDALTRLRKAQMDDSSTDAELKMLRAALNRAYDGFVKRQGPINVDANKRIFRDDPTWPQIAALEESFDKGVSLTVSRRTGEKPRKPSAKKAAIFSKRTQSPYKPVKYTTTAKDALVATLSEKGRVDMDYLASLYGKSKMQIREELRGLILRNPAGGWETRDQYLSGNVKAKLAVAEEAAKTDAEYQENIEALKAVQPADIEAIDIDVKIGAHWLPPSVMGAFVDHITGGDGGQANYSEYNAKWTFASKRAADAKATQWGTDRKRPLDLLSDIANQKATTVRDRMDDGSSVLNQAATDAAKEKAQQIKDEWRRWIWQDAGRRDTLARLYNDTFNTDVLREFDGSHLKFPGKISDDIVSLRPHQANAVWRIVQSGTTLLDHVVGAGKTYTIIAAAMEMRRLGLANKPVIAVPNHLVGQWAEDFIKLYPGANILAATKKDFEKANRKRLFARIATGDWDAVIVAHSSFGKVEVDPEYQAKFIKQQVRDIDTAIAAMKDAEGGKSRSVKDAEKQKDRLQEKLKSLFDAENKDDSLYYGELGIDALFLDEAHEFKNLGFATSMTRVAGLGDPKGSQKAADMYMKIQYTLDKTGGRNVVFATGTPISNTMAEMYTMERYLDYKTLKAKGLAHFDAWARQYGEVVTDWELSPSGKYKLNSRFSKFVNMPELMQDYLSFSDVINRDDINKMLAVQGKKLPVPRIKGGKPQNVVVDRSDLQASFIGMPIKDKDGNDTDKYPDGTLVWRSENLPKGPPKKGDDNMLKIMSDARKAALDMRLISPSYGDNEKSKINYAAGEILRKYKEWNADRGTQLVFIDLSTPKNARASEAAEIRALIERAEAGDEAATEKLDNMSPDELDALNGEFSVYDDLREKLIALGIPDSEIAYIHQANTEQQKEDLFGKVRSGRIRVLLGSTAKMGAGMNVQERLVALHHMDAPWRPSDLEQREGRIIRQGNALYDRDPKGFEIEIMRYATKQTLDSRMWQTIEGKARFIEQVRKGNLTDREVEDVAGEAANAAEMKAASSGNPLILEEMEIRSGIRRMEGLQYEHDRQQFRIQDSIRHNQGVIEHQIKRITDLQKDIKTRDENASDSFAIVISGKEYTKRKDAGAQLILSAAELGKSGKAFKKAGVFQGFNLTLDNLKERGFIVSMQADAGEYQIDLVDISTADPVGLITKINNVTKGFEKSIEQAQTWMDNAKSEIHELKSQIKKWDKADELKAMKARHAEIIAELRPKKKAEEAKDESKPDDTSFLVKRSADAAPVLAHDAVERIVAKVRLRFAPPNLKITVVRTESALPQKIQDKAEEYGATGEIRAVYHNGSIYLVSHDNFRSQLEVEEALAHEISGHSGGKLLLGKEIKPAYQRLYFALKSEGVRKIALEHGIDMRQEFATADGLDPLDRPYYIVDELLAHLQGERVYDSLPGRLKRAIKEFWGAVRNWLRNKGLVKLAEVSDTDLQYLLKRMRQAAKEGVIAEQNGEPVFVMASDDRTAFSRGNPGRASDTLKRKFGLKPKQGGIRKFIDRMRNTPWGDLKRHLSDEWTQGALDRFYGIKRAEQEYSGPLNAGQSGYVATRLSTGLSSIITATLHYGTPQWNQGILQKIPDSKGLLEVLGPVQEDINDWLVWMGSKRAKRLFRQGRENNLTLNEINEGLKLADGREALFQQVADDYSSFMGKILDVAEGAGLIKPDGRAMWEHADYVPFYRMTLDEFTTGPKGRKGISHQTAGIRRLRGADVATNDLLENIVMNVTHLIDASMKNNALRKTIRNLAGTGLYEDASMEFKAELIPMSQVKRRVKDGLAAQGWDEMNIDQYVDMMPPEAIEGIQKMWAMKAPADPDIVRVMVGGKAKYYRVFDPLLLRALTQINTDKMGGIVNVMRSFKRILTAGVTASPEFMARNFIRDAAHAWAINEDGFTLGVDSVRGVRKTMKLWAKDVDHSATGGAIDMMMAGGSFLGGYIHGTDPAETARSIRAALRKRGFTQSMQDDFMGTVVDTSAKYWDKYREIGDAIENASREATYEASVKAGKSKAQAVFDAKDLMDYSMQGQWALFQFMGDVVPFFNARVQGLYKLKRAGAVPGWGSKGAVIMRGGMIAAASLALLALNWGDDRYEELEDWDKDIYWHFWIGDQHLRIPKPFEIGVIFGTIPERMARLAGGKDDHRKAVKQLWWNFAETFNLVGMPQMIAPAMEVYANRDSFTKRDIEGMADEGKLKSARYNEGTSETMRAIGSVVSDTINLSPKQLEHLWNGYLGTLGMYILGASDMVVRVAMDKPETPTWRLDDYPVLKSFARSAPARSTRYKTELYEMLRESEQVYRTIKDKQKQGLGEEARDIVNENRGKLKARGSLRKAATGLKALRQQVDQVYRDRSMTAGQKRERVDKLMERENILARRAVERTHPFFNQ